MEEPDPRLAAHAEADSGSHEDPNAEEKPGRRTCRRLGERTGEHVSKFNCKKQEAKHDGVN